MIFIIAILLLVVGCTPIPVGVPNPTNKNDTAWLIIFNGESNSGGAVKYPDSLTIRELAPQPQIQILNNKTLNFEPLLLGTNSLLNHTGFIDNTKYGWDNALAGIVTSDNYWGDTVFLIKTGYGGSTAHMWLENYGNGGIFETNIRARYNAATLRINKPYKVAVFITLGINDYYAGTNPMYFKDHLTSHITHIRALVGINTPVVLTKFMGGKQYYDAVIDEISNELPYTYAVSGEDASLIDPNHWGYSGHKIIMERMMNVLKSNNL